jgi:radical SAM superfamily enzyme with C-terminal helix-hairpin-helix motif
MKKTFVLLVISSLCLGILAACGSSTAASSVPATTVPAAIQATEVATQAVEIATTAPTEAPVATVGSSAVAAVMTKLNLNTSTGDEYLQAIPGFSSRMVREFLEYRPYLSILQFRQEIGKYVDEAQVAEYENYVFVPVSVDSSDAATLMQIPGLDETSAAALIAARPFGSNEAFLAKLAELAPGIDQAVAASYLLAQ